MIAGGEDSDGTASEGADMLLQEGFIRRHLLHFRSIGVVHRKFRIGDLQQLGVQFCRPGRLR